jgi:PKD repeat protein
MIALVAFAIWAPNATAFSDFGGVGSGNNCAADGCHAGQFGAGNGDATHLAHAEIVGENNCTVCHGGFPTNLGNNCTQCHNGPGLRTHHRTAGNGPCAGCHDNPETPPTEDTVPPGYTDGNSPVAIIPLAPCDGSEEVFASFTRSLDNDGDLLYDGNDLDCQGNQPPVADPNGPYNGTVNEAVTFDGSASNDPDGTIASYDWDFGDGSTGTGVNPTHTYTATGTFTVTLTVTDDGGATDTATTTATIGEGNQPPVADPNGPYTGTVGEAVFFDGTGSNDPDGTIVAFEWDFGDGNTGTGATPSHTYAAEGTFNVTLMVTDDAGATDSATTTATIGQVTNEPPVADPNGPYTGTAGMPVTFDGSGSTDSDGTIASYDWNFGDGASGTGVSPTHTYAADGVFTVSLTVTDDAGATDSATTTATIGQVTNEPPVADPNGPYTGTVGVAVVFDGTGSNDPDGTIVAFEWDFGDGNTGTGETPSHTYAADGTFTVTLTVTDDGSATGTATTTATIGVGNQAPVADPNGPYTGTVGVAVVFDGRGSNDPDGTIVAFEWDFGDGNTGTGQTPTHTYATADTFNVTLTVTDDGGATDSKMTTATINRRQVIEAEVEAPGAINGANRGKTPVEIEFEEDGMQVEIAELRCGGNVSNAMATPERINAEDDEEFTALFRTRDLELTCEDTAIVCTGTLADGTTFTGMDETRVIRDFEGDRCKQDDKDKDDDDKHDRDDDKDDDKHDRDDD